MDRRTAGRKPRGRGWGEHPADATNDHATVLALWTLLATARPPVADLPWIPAR